MIKFILRLFKRVFPRPRGSDDLPHMWGDDLLISKNDSREIIRKFNSGEVLSEEPAKSK